MKSLGFLLILVILPSPAVPWKCDFETDACGIKLKKEWKRTDGAGSGLAAPPQDHTFGSLLDICDFETSACNFTADPIDQVTGKFWKRYKYQITKGLAYKPPDKEHTEIRTGKGEYAAWLASGFTSKQGVPYRWSSDPFNISTCGLDFWYALALPAISVTNTQSFAKFTLVAEFNAKTEMIYNDTRSHTGGWKNVKVDVPVGFRDPGSRYHFEIINNSSASWATGSYYIDDISFLRCGHFVQSQPPGTPRILLMEMSVTPENNPICLRFHYWTYGPSQYKVVVQYVQQGSSNYPELSYGLSSQSWDMLEVELPAKTTSIFISHYMKLKEETMAVDDIEIDPMPCPTTTRVPSTTLTSATSPGLGSRSSPSTTIPIIMTSRSTTPLRFTTTTTTAVSTEASATVAATSQTTSRTLPTASETKNSTGVTSGTGNLAAGADDSDTGLTTGAKAGVGVGVGLGILGIAAGILGYCFVAGPLAKRRKVEDKEEDEENVEDKKPSTEDSVVAPQEAMDREVA